MERLADFPAHTLEQLAAQLRRELHHAYEEPQGPVTPNDIAAQNYRKGQRDLIAHVEQALEAKKQEQHDGI